MFDIIDIYKLNWSPITVDGYNQKKNEVTMVFNCDITNNIKSLEVINYVAGRTFWCCQNFPNKATIILSFDIRGQGVIMTKSSAFKVNLLKLIKAFNTDNQILIDFLR